MPIACERYHYGKRLVPNSPLQWGPSQVQLAGPLLCSLRHDCSITNMRLRALIIALIQDSEAACGSTHPGLGRLGGGGAHAPALAVMHGR